MLSNRQIIAAEGTINTESLNNGGLLQPEQARKFIQQTFETNELGKYIRYETRVSKTGEIDKIGIGRRILRAKTEGQDDGNRTGVNTSRLPYATTAVKANWELTEETIRENIERENLPEIVTNLMATQIGLDKMDLCLNGDVDIDSGNPDYKFLCINDGWVKQLKKGHVIDRKASSGMNIGMFYDTLKAIPNKYNNGNLRWLMSPHRGQEWERHLLEQIIEKGGAVPQGVYTSPASIPIIECPSLGDDTIILTDPKNLIVVHTYDIKIRSTTEGKDAIYNDMRYYTCHFDLDAIIEEIDATAIITNISA